MGRSEDDPEEIRRRGGSQNRPLHKVSLSSLVDKSGNTTQAQKPGKTPDQNTESGTSGEDYVSPHSSSSPKPPPLHEEPVEKLGAPHRLWLGHTPTTDHTGTRARNDPDFDYGEIIRAPYISLHTGPIDPDDKQLVALPLLLEKCRDRTRWAWVQMRYFIVLCRFNTTLIVLPMFTYGGKGLRSKHEMEKLNYMAVRSPARADAKNDSPWRPPLLHEKSFVNSMPNSYVWLTNPIMLEHSSTYIERTGPEKGPGGKHRPIRPPARQSARLIRQSYIQLVDTFLKRVHAGFNPEWRTRIQEQRKALVQGIPLKSPPGPTPVAPWARDASSAKSNQPVAQVAQKPLGAPSNHPQQEVPRARRTSDTVPALDSSEYPPLPSSKPSMTLNQTPKQPPGPRHQVPQQQ